MEEAIELARANPDKFNISTPPIGTAGSIQAELLKVRANLPKLVSVVFKGGGDSMEAVLNGTVQMTAGSIPPAMPHIKAGTLRCLAVLAKSRWPDLPDVPTMEEVGYKDFVLAVDAVLLAPAKTPPRKRQMAGGGDAESARHAGDEGAAVRRRALRCGSRAPTPPGRASPTKSPCSATSSPRPASRRCSERGGGVRRSQSDRPAAISPPSMTSA